MGRLSEVLLAFGTTYRGVIAGQGSVVRHEKQNITVLLEPALGLRRSTHGRTERHKDYPPPEVSPLLTRPGSFERGPGTPRV